VRGILIDTNIVVAIAQERLERSKAAILADSSVEAFVSVASLWEIAIKHRIGKLEFSEKPEDLTVVLRALNFVILPVDEMHVFADIEEEIETKDPFDRLLLGVCAAEGLRLLTTDRALAEHPLAWRAVPQGKK
jgi:PIN domain nuclease of toxin-antitoxin system